MRTFILIILTVILTGCGTSDSALRDAGFSEAYVQGFHDGRHSGMSEEGNPYEHYIRDERRFTDDSAYRDGWLAGEIEGEKLQANATTIGNTAAGAFEALQIQKEVDRQTDFEGIARDAVKGVSTENLKDLE